MKRILATLTFLFLTHFIFGETFYIKHFDVKIEVNQEGYFDVTETLDVFFNEKSRGIIRAIPKQVLLDGKKYSIQIENIEVDDWRMKAYREGPVQMIRIGEKNTYLDGDQKYVIHYRVYDAFHFLENHTEFKWNITGDEWEVPIHKATYSVFFPDNVNMEVNDFIVAAGKRNQNNNNVIVTFDGQFLKGETTQKLQPKEGVSLYAKLPKGYIDREAIMSREAEIEMMEEEESFKIYDPYFVFPLALFGWFITLYRRKGQYRKFEKDESFEHYPPEELNPSEVSAFFERRPDTEDLVALLPMWANLGYVRIQGGKENDGGLRFEKIQDLPEDAFDYEHTVFNALFSGNEIIFLPDLKEKLYSSMATAKMQLSKNIEARHYLFDKESVDLFHSWKMVGLSVLALLSGILILVLSKGTALITGILLLILAGILFVIYFLPLKMSEEGARMYQHIHRFRNFLKSKNPDNVDKLLEKDPTYFEKMYPYAVAFGLDQVYTQKFETTMRRAPSWYYYNERDAVNYDGTPLSAFNDFSVQFQPSEIKQVFNSTPPPEYDSSGSGGGSFSGGGGSSGGGFGGGGGSSW